MAKPMLVQALARAILAGELARVEMKARCVEALGRNWRWVGPLARRCEAEFAGRRPRLREVERFLGGDEGLREALGRYGGLVRVERMVWEPVGAGARWGVRELASETELAEWLGVTAGELRWFADLQGRNGRGADALGHYRYAVQEKRSGGVRLLEAPKERLKGLQRRVLEDVLGRVPVHGAAHGFARGRSVQSFVAPHVGQAVVLRMDLRDFFPSITRARVQAWFRVAGYAEAVADLLGGLCTNAAPRRYRAAGELYLQPHLPQGAPTSPALANAIAFGLDCRLAGLATSAGASYTRYADDLAFSGDEEFAGRARRFALHVAAVAIDEGFAVQHRKTRVMRQGVRQQLAGLVVNERANVRRREYEELKAILTNCARHGAAGQNREGQADFRAHLEGRVAWVASVHAARGEKLRALLRSIDWGLV